MVLTYLHLLDPGDLPLRNIMDLPASWQVFFGKKSHWLVDYPAIYPGIGKTWKHMETIQRYSGLVDRNDTQMNFPLQ